jgi:alpha-L-rhamnosidase
MSIRPCTFAVVALLALSVPTAQAQTAAVRPEQLRCEYRANPLGIDVVQPRLSWVLAPADPKARGLKQSTYRVLVASSDANLRADKGDLWDTGKVQSDQSIQLAYAGKALASGAQAFWKVQVWDQAGKPSAWSQPAHWSMGLLKLEDWKGKWIGRDEDKVLRRSASPYWSLQNARWIWFPAGDPAKSAPAGARFFRAALSVPADRKIVKATAVAGADSSFELFLNGQETGKGRQVQMPEVFDISASLHPGRNVLAIQATNARAGKPAGLIAAVRIDFDRGDPLLSTTGANWRTAQKAPEAWNQPDFDDSTWEAAKDLGPYGMEPWSEVGFTQERYLPARMLRKEFDVPKKLKRATAYVSGLGLSDLYLNGGKVDNRVLSPGLTDYDKHVLYVTFDATKQLVAGRNALGLLLGNGRFFAPRAMRTFGYPKAIVQLDLEYEDGSRSSVVSDESWKLTTEGPIRLNNEYDGEEYDARREIGGWARPGFDDSRWEAAQAVAAPAGLLAAEMAEPLRVTETLRPVKVTEIRPGVFIFDMGQNLVGWCRLRVSGPAGTQVRLRHAETLKDNGELYVDNLRSARATDLYTLKGVGSETWEPRFTYHGFRYVEVTGFPGKPPLTALEGRVVHDDMARIADFSSSNPLLNQIHKSIFWGVRGNYRSIPTDCPQRDERQGWLGDRSMVSRSESYLFDVAAFYSKWMVDLVDSQRDSGSIPNVAPAYWVIYSDNITWPSTFIFVPAMLYDQYGDRRAIETHYPAMKKWIEYMRGFLEDGLMPRDTYGDWCVPPESPKLIHSQDPARITDKTLLGTTYYYHLLRLMARYARLLDKPQDAAGFEDLAASIRTAFEKKFYSAEAGYYSNGTQTSSILPLAFGITPEQNRGRVFDRLIDKIERESNGHVGTGLVGAQWLMRTLSDNGRADVAYQIANQKTYPGWGYMIQRGATTIWELWNGDTADPAMNSGNHVMQIGDLGVWMYEYLAGIRTDPEQPGFKHILVRPYPLADLSFVKASHQSMYGTISSAWKRDGGRLRLDITIPANTGASVYVPAKEAAAVSESGQPAAKAKGVKFLRMEAGAAVFEVGSGSYSFTSPL